MGKRGPNTPESKAAVRHNALKHGLTSDAPVIPSESLAEWERFLAGIIAGYQRPNFKSSRSGAAILELFVIQHLKTAKQF